MNDWLIVGALGMLFLILIQLSMPQPLDSPFELNDRATFNSHLHQN
jgi:hypothetical protein